MEVGIILGGVYLLASLLGLFLSKKFKVPVLLFFLAIGIITQAPTHIEVKLDWVKVASNLALAIILFSGALETSFVTFKKLARPSLALSTIGVLISALLLGLFVYFILGFGLIESILCGAVVSSTDAASIFNVLKGTKKPINEDVKSILEIESGCNDPMAYGLIALLLGLLGPTNMTITKGIFNFALAVIVGALIGIIIGKIVSKFLQKFSLQSVEKIVILLFATIFITFGVSELLHGNSLLAIYIAGLIVGNTHYDLRIFSIHFFDTITWLVQIALFILLGVVVAIEDVLAVAPQGILLSLLLIFIVRPIAVYISLLGSKIAIKKQAFIAWSGLKGAVPIIFALYVLQAQTTHSREIFHIVFFVVIFSVLIQGTLLEKIAQLFGVLEKPSARQDSISMLELEAMEDLITKLKIKDKYAGLTIEQTPILNCYLVVSIKRDGNYIVPSAKTVLKKGDELMFVEKTGCIISFDNGTQEQEIV